MAPKLYVEPFFLFLGYFLFSGEGRNLLLPIVFCYFWAGGPKPVPAKKFSFPGV